MAKRISIINDKFGYDLSGDVYYGKVSNYLTLTNPKNFNCHVFEPPSGADIAVEGVFRVPDIYVSTPKVIVGGYFVGAPANTFGMGFELLGRAVSENVDTAFEAADLASESTWSGISDKDYFELVIDLTVTLAPFDTVPYKCFRDDSVDNQSQRFLMTDLEFQFEIS